MKQVYYQTAIKRITIAIGLALLLLIIGLMPSVWAANTLNNFAIIGPLPVAQPGSNTHALPDQSNLVVAPSFPLLFAPPPKQAAIPAAVVPSINMQAATSSDNSGVTVRNGDKITYTIQIINSGGNLTNIQVFDDLNKDLGGSKKLKDVLQNVTCLGSITCAKAVITTEVPSPVGGTTVVSTVTKLTWDIGPLTASTSIVLQFTANVINQLADVQFSNEAVVYNAGTGEAATSSIIQTTVIAPLTSENGQPKTGGPSWFSDDLGGTFSLDWGDYDRDGDLDLVVGATTGLRVFRNDNGVMVEAWAKEGDSYYTLGVRWADFVSGGNLEIVAVGHSTDPVNSPDGQGTNYIYDSNGLEVDTFQSFRQLVRVEPGDYDGDGNIDLIVSTNQINPICPVFFYQNQGGYFVDEISPRPSHCISNFATAALGAGDYDNDGDLDLALGLIPDKTKVVINKTVTSSLIMSASATDGAIPIDRVSLDFLPYDFAWGDFDRDGDLDLAEALPLQREVRIHRNKGGTAGFETSPIIKSSDLFFTPRALSWGNFNGDIFLELVTADPQPRVYQYNGKDDFNSIPALRLPQISNILWDLAPADADNDADLDFAVGNLSDASQIVTSFGAHLSPTLTVLNPLPSNFATASSVAWGDVNGDNKQDLLFGRSLSGNNNKTLAYTNLPDGKENIQIVEGIGLHSVAAGDVDGDGDMDIALGTNLNTLIFNNTGGVSWPDGINLLDVAFSRSAAWGDTDQDGDLDLFVGNTGSNVLYVNQGTGLDSTPFWSSSETDDTYQIALTDYNQDNFLDFVAANALSSQPTLIYHNNKDNTFSVADSVGSARNTYSVTWGDYDADGDPDLFLGNYEQSNDLYQNNSGSFSLVWSTAEIRATTGVAWGDWDNDGDLDLAVGNDGQPDQVYINEGSTGSPNFEWNWTSQEAGQTTGLAWGDMDNDGDLDLAVSSNTAGQSGIYENQYATPVHLGKSVPLPNNPPYLSINRPTVTNTAKADFYSAADYFGPPLIPVSTGITVPITFIVHDPEDHPLNWSNAKFEYSTGGGGQWLNATIANTPTNTAATVAGGQHTITWKASLQNPPVVADDVRFRITIVPQDPVGPTQRAWASATSPPFRVRAITCTWIADPIIIPTLNGSAFISAPINSTIDFEGDILTNKGGTSGQTINWIWQFGDGSQGSGPITSHSYTTAGSYIVTLLAEGTACPSNTPVPTVFVNTVIQIGDSSTSLPDFSDTIFLPIILKDNTVSSLMVRKRPIVLPNSVTTFSGSNSAGNKATVLSWQVANKHLVPVTGYHIYRRREPGPASFQLLDILSARITTYTDPTFTCEQTYYITAFNARGESPASATSYTSPPCQN